MAQLISAVYGTTTFDAGIPELTDGADIRRAIADYHYGPGNTGASSTTTGINYHLSRMAQLAGATFTGAVTFNNTVSGQEPTAGTHLVTKNYVDGSAGITSSFFLGGM